MVAETSYQMLGLLSFCAESGGGLTSFNKDKSNVVEEIERCVNIDLDRIRIWLAANKLTLNTTKTEFLLIGSRQRLSTLERNPIIEINKFPIKHVSTSKSLGVHIDGNLSWECHINEISKKIASGISDILQYCNILPCIFPHFTLAWFPIGSLDLLHVLRFTRVITLVSISCRSNGKRCWRMRINRFHVGISFSP